MEQKCKCGKEFGAAATLRIHQNTACEGKETVVKRVVKAVKKAAKKK